MSSPTRVSSAVQSNGHSVVKTRPKDSTISDTIQVTSKNSTTSTDLDRQFETGPDHHIHPHPLVSVDEESEGDGTVEIEVTATQLHRLSRTMNRILGSHLDEHPRAIPPSSDLVDHDALVESAHYTPFPARFVHPNSGSFSLHEAEVRVHEELLKALPDTSSSPLMMPTHRFRRDTHELRPLSRLRFSNLSPEVSRLMRALDLSMIQVFAMALLISNSALRIGMKSSSRLYPPWIEKSSSHCLVSITKSSSSYRNCSLLLLPPLFTPRSISRVKPISPPTIVRSRRYPRNLQGPLPNLSSKSCLYRLLVLVAQSNDKVPPIAQIPALS